MSICNDNHGEVCYDGRYCPVCEKMKDINELEEEINRLREANVNLTKELESRE